MLGYFRDPEGTRAVLDVDGFFHTGDLVTMDADGQIRIIGRIKDQFKTSKGKYVVPAPIESRLGEHPAVESCCLMGAGLPTPFALVLLTDDARKQVQDPRTRTGLEESLAQRLAQINEDLDPHERVGFIAIVAGPWNIENGLITPTMKIRRSSIESRYLELIDQWRAKNAPVVWESAAAEGASQAL